MMKIKIKKARDPNAPKRGLYAYIFFCMENCDKVKAECPDMKITQVTLELGRRWKELPYEERARYMTMQHEDGERYKSELARYVPQTLTNLTNNTSAANRE